VHDVVVVGAGSAGVPLAARLSEDRDRSVVLVEAGPDYPDFAQLPDELKYGYATGALAVVSGAHDWRFVGRATALAQAMPVARGKVTGGSSAINGQVFLRGLPEDFNGWAAAGNAAWSYEEVLPFLRRVEDQITVRRFAPEEWLPAHAAFYDACRAAGFRDCADANDPWSDGVGPYPLNNVDGIRISTALAYLPQARERSNLRIEPRTLARRVLFDGKRAVAVEVERDGIVTRLEGREIVLAAGAIGSPHLLLLSGVGPREDLAAVGIPAVHDLPEVGRNLQDHPMVAVTWQLKPAFASRAGDPRFQILLRYTATGSAYRNDIWICNLVYERLLTMYPGIHLPAARGELRLVSPDPHVQPSLDYRYLEPELDRRRLREAVRLCVRLAQQEPLAAALEERHEPGEDDLASDEALDEWLLRRVITSNHVTSTCSMGHVVDSEGRVRGVEALRVADASIIPTIVRANTNATSIMIGERVAEAMRRRG
jgi:choline dehydrogenase